MESYSCVGFCCECRKITVIHKTQWLRNPATLVMGTPYILGRFMDVNQALQHSEAHSNPLFLINSPFYWPRIGVILWIRGSTNGVPEFFFTIAIPLLMPWGRYKCDLRNSTLIVILVNGMTIFHFWIFLDTIGTVWDSNSLALRHHRFPVWTLTCCGFTDRAK